MSRTKEESCLSNPASFISSSNVLKLAAMLVMTLLLSSLINIQTANAQVTFGFKLGSYGTGNGQLHRPQGVAVDSTGRIIVADTYNNRIQVFDSSGTFLFNIGSYGQNSGQFYYPEGVAVDGSGRIIVVDWGNYRIQVFNSSGNFLFKFGSPGSDPGHFIYPQGVAVDGSGKNICS